MGIQTAGKHAVVIGRSNIVGKPVSILLARKDVNCTVPVWHIVTVQFTTPLLRARVDRALAFAEAQAAAGGKAPVFVLSGGQGPDEIVSEAESMRGYLASRGVPAERILLEDRSTDTAENMRFSKELIFARDPEAVTAFSTTNFHVFRSGLKARRVIKPTCPTW